LAFQQIFFLQDSLVKLDTILHNPHFFFSPIQDVDLFFCNNLSLSTDRILKFVDSELAQNFDRETNFFEWPPSKV